MIWNKSLQQKECVSENSYTGFCIQFPQGVKTLPEDLVLSDNST